MESNNARKVEISIHRKNFDTKIEVSDLASLREAIGLVSHSQALNKGLKMGRESLDVAGGVAELEVRNPVEIVGKIGEEEVWKITPENWDGFLEAIKPIKDWMRGEIDNVFSAGESRVAE
jgi:hypothetical protein